MIEYFTEWWLDSWVYKVWEFCCVKPFKCLCKWLFKIYITTKIKNRIINDLEYTYKEPDPLLKEALAIIKKGKFVITESEEYSRKQKMGLNIIDISNPPKVKIYHLSIRIYRQKFLEYKNKNLRSGYQHSNKITLKELLEQRITKIFDSYVHFLHSGLKEYQLIVKLDSK